MGLIKLVQIEGGRDLLSQLESLNTSYAAERVSTKVVKIPAEGQPEDPDYVAPVYYDAEALLEKLFQDVLNITDGSGGVNLTSLSAALELLNAQLNGGTVDGNTLEGLKNKQINDIVRITLSRTGGSVDISSVNMQYLDSSNTALSVYSSGNHLITGAFSGTPAELDINASKSASGDTLIYKPITGDFEFKIFATGTWTLENIPSNAFLDNNELQMIAYEQAINKIVVQLAKDSDLITAIRQAIGPTAIQNAVNVASQVIDARIKRLEENSTTGAVRYNNVVGLIDETIDSTISVYTKNAVDKLVTDINTNADSLDGRIDVLEDTSLRNNTLIQTVDIETNTPSETNTFSEKALVIHLTGDAVAIAGNANAITNLSNTVSQNYMRHEDLIQEVKGSVVVNGAQVTDNRKTLSETAITAKFAAHTSSISDLDATRYQWSNITGTAAQGEEGTEDYIPAEAVTANTHVYSTDRVDKDIAATRQTLNDRITQLNTAMDTRVAALEAVQEITEKCFFRENETTGNEEFEITHTPTAAGIIVFVNGVTYEEIEGCYRREGTLITWDPTAAGFTLSQVLEYGQYPTVKYKYLTE